MNSIDAPNKSGAVLEVISGRGPTGPVAGTMGDARALTECGVRVFAALKSGIDPKPNAVALAEAGVPGECHFFDFSFPRGIAGMVKLPADARRMSALVASEKIETVHVHRTDEQWLAALALGSERHRKLVRTWHRDPEETPRSLRRMLVENCAGCVCVSRKHEASLRAAGARHVRFIHCATDTEFYAPLKSREPGPVLIGQVGHWKIERGEDRGQRAALRVLAGLPRELNWRGVLLGRGVDEADLRAFAYEELRLPPERVEITNSKPIPPKDYAARLAAFDIGLVFCTGSDGSSRPAVEMLSCGVPLLVADRPGISDFAEHPASALLSPTVETVESLIRDPQRLRAMQSAARERALSVHTYKARGEQLLSFFNECAN